MCCQRGTLVNVILERENNRKGPIQAIGELLTEACALFAIDLLTAIPGVVIVPGNTSALLAAFPLFVFPACDGDLRPHLLAVISVLHSSSSFPLQTHRFSFYELDVHGRLIWFHAVLQAAANSKHDVAELDEMLKSCGMKLL